MFYLTCLTFTMSESESGKTKCGVTGNPKKRPKTILSSDVIKKLRIASHSTGDDCKCTRLQCFKEVPEEARRQIIGNFNEKSSHDEQNLYLSGLISVLPVKQWRSRKSNPEESTYNAHSYSYKVRFIYNDAAMEKVVCYKAFLSIHGITNKRGQNIKKALVENGKPKPDKRGKHSNRKHQLPETTKEAVIKHISSFKGRKSHYSIHDSDRIYLPDSLDVKKMHKMFTEDNPTIAISYESYRTIFLTKFNISFGYPRTDTCSYCDEMNAKIASKQNEKDELEKLKLELKLHLHKADKLS